MASQWSCAVCDRKGVCEEEVEAKIAALLHVGQNHPLVYRQATGHMPTEEWLALQVAAMRIGA